MTFKGKWTPYIVQGIEVCVIRADNQHGFESLGWSSPNEKIILFETIDESDSRRKPQLKFLKQETYKLAVRLAKRLNERENSGKEKRNARL